jgi:tetratricopeptide (TPR) repeat protein
LNAYRLFGVFLVILCAAPLHAAAERPEEGAWDLYQRVGNPDPAWDPLVREGIALVWKGEGFDALDRFDKAFGQGCACPVVHAICANVAADLKLGVEVVEIHAQETFRLSEGRTDLTYSKQQSWYALGLAHRAAEELTESLDASRRGLALDPNSERWAGPLRELIDSVERRIQTTERSEVLAERLRKPRGTDAEDAALADEALKSIGALRKEGDVLRAEALCRAAREQRPDHPGLMKAHRRVLCDLKRFPEAEELDLRLTALAEQSGDKRALFRALSERCDTFFADFSYDGGKSNFDRLCGLDPMALTARMAGLAEALSDNALRYEAAFAKAVSQELFTGEYGVLNLRTIETLKLADELAVKNGWDRRAKEVEGWLANMLACCWRLEESEAYSRKAGLPVETIALICRQDWQALYDRFKNSADALEIKTLEMPTERLKRAALGYGDRLPLDIFIVACLKLGHFTEAVETVERLNHRTLGEILSSRAFEARKQVIAARGDSREKAEERLQGLAGRLADARKQGDDAQVRSIQRDLTVQAAALAGIKADLHADELEIRDATGHKPMDILEIQSLLDPDTAIVLYGASWSGWAFYGMVGVVTDREVCGALQPSLSSVGKPGNALSWRLDPFLALVHSPNLDARSAQELYYYSRSLHEQLIQPVNDYIADKRRLIVIPTGPLATVPFHLLRDRNGRMLLEEHVVSYAQSIGVLKHCLGRGKKVGGDVVVVADPARPEPGARLRFAETEASAIRGVFPSAEILTGDRATETAVKRALSTADVLHFACHGLLDRKSPMNSALALTPDDVNDGLLTAREICDFPVKAGLVVLSACESGSGALSPGWQELVGMSRAWLLAGTPSAVLSLWRIDDRATGELMAEFYGNLATMPRAEALRKAQMTMTEKYAAPYYWGAFVLYGDYR